MKKTVFSGPEEMTSLLVVRSPGLDPGLARSLCNRLMGTHPESQMEWARTPVSAYLVLHSVGALEVRVNWPCTHNRLGPHFGVLRTATP